MDLGLHGKRALILAASQGLGFAAAKALANEGVIVAISSSNIDRAKVAADKLCAETNGRIEAFEGDVSNPDNMNDLHTKAVSGLGGNVDILVNNHGGPAIGSALEMNETEFRAEFEKMVMSLIRLTSLCLPAMREQKWGRIFSVGGAGVVQPMPNNVLSNTLRAAMSYYMKSLATEVIVDGVTVNVVSPSQIETDRMKKGAVVRGKMAGITASEHLVKQAGGLPSKRFGDVEDFGAMIAFLSGKNGSYCTGSNWRIDGGMLRSIV